MSDYDLVRYLATGATPFTRLQLVPGARIAVFYDSPDERQPRTIAGASFIRDGGPMYVAYDTPLPSGVVGMYSGGGIGTLDMGKITPIVEWKPLGKNRLVFQGWRGKDPVFSGTSPQSLYVVSAGRVVRAKDDITFVELPSPDLGLPGGAKCRIARNGPDYYLEARSPSGSRMRLTDAQVLDAALRGLEKRRTADAVCFRFADHDFVQFYTYSSSPILYRIDEGALTLIGGGVAISGGDAGHILLMFDGDRPRSWYNEEEAPKQSAVAP